MSLLMNINLHDGETLELVLLRIITVVHNFIMMNNIIIKIIKELTAITIISTGELFTLVQNIKINSKYNIVTYYLYSLYIVWLVIEMMEILMM